MLMKVSKRLMVLLLVLGVVILCYPFMGSFYTQIQQTIEVESHNAKVRQIDEERKREMQQAMEEYNKKISEEESAHAVDDPFSDGKDSESGNNLSFDDSIIGTIKIPVINVNLPIYKDTSEKFLLKGVGYLNGTSFPSGGESTHCVLTGHSAIPTAKLFTDLEKVNIGDAFFIMVLDEVHAYRVDQIKVVLPSDTSVLKIEPGKDYTSLITCTPYGINTHRLIVRGIRDDSLISDDIVQDDSYFWKLLLGSPYFIIAIILIILVLILTLIWLFMRKKNKNKDRDSYENKETH